MPRKRQYHIVNASQDPVVRIDVDGRSVKMDKQGQAYVYDTGLAEEIDARFGHKARGPDGGAVVVIPVDDSDPTREPGHQYSFTVPDLSRFKKRKG